MDNRKERGDSSGSPLNFVATNAPARQREALIKMGPPQKDSACLSDLQRGVNSPADRLLDLRSSDTRQPSSGARQDATVNMERRAKGVKIVRDSTQRSWCTMQFCITVIALFVLATMCTLLFVWCSRLALELSEVKQALLQIHAKPDCVASSAPAETGVTSFQIEEDLSDHATASARDIFLGRVRRAPNDKSNGKKGKGRKKGKGGKKECKCRGKRGKDGPTGPQGPEGQKGPPGDRGPPGPAASTAPSVNGGEPSRLRAAHYTAPRLDTLYSPSQFQPNTCIHRDEWEGEVCGNKTFKISSKPTEVPLKFFEPNSWSPKGFEPPVPQDDGSFVMKEPGLYLLYITVTFYDSKFTQGYSVFINGNSRFKCFGGIDYIYSDMTDQFNKKQRSCAGTGVHYLAKGDRVQVKNLYSDAVVDISQDATFFGLVLLEPQPLPHDGAN